MIPTIPFFVEAIFIGCTIYTLIAFYYASNHNKTFIFISLGWLTLQAILAHQLFYTKTDSIPPRILLAFVPVLLFILLLFNTKKGKAFIDSLNQKKMVLVHLVRIPVEFGLLYLFIYKQIPEIMSFEGANFDIIAGFTAPFIYYFGYVKTKMNKTLLLLWNIGMTLLLINIIVLAILAAPTPFQQIAFDQPNVGVLYFPFIWLPAYIVPVVLFSHFTTIRQLIKK